MSQRLQGHACLAGAMIMVGSTVVASKVIAAGLPPFTATALRFALALPCFWLLMRATGTAWPRPGRRDAVLLVLQAVAGSVGYTALLISGLRLTSAADASVVIGTLPVVTALIAVALLGERPRLPLLVAIALATAGVLAVALPAGAQGQGSLVGNALVLAAMVCEGLFILLNRRLRQPVPPLALSAVISAIGLAACVVPALFEAPWRIALAWQAVAAVAYYAIVPTVGGFVLWYAGSARTSGTEAALFTALAPVSAMALAVTLLGEAVTPMQLGGVGCVLGAMLCLVLVRPADGVGRAAGANG